jgi:GrpB-like predicted nucleotidyltransferase (UPF0157 family)
MPSPADEAPIEIRPYDPSWPMQFLEEARAIRAALRIWLAGPIEHIGSTAIHGLAGKAVIDMMGGVHDLDGSRAAIEAAARLGYCYAPYRACLL